MKTSIASIIYVLGIAINPAQASIGPQWTTEDINLHCQGDMQVFSVSHLEDKSHTIQTRSPIPVVLNSKTALVKFKITTVSAGCAQAQKQFQLSYHVQPGASLYSKVKMEGIHTDQELKEFVPIGSMAQFKLNQEFSSATKDGLLPLFPLYHSELVEMKTSGANYAKGLSFDLKHNNPSSLLKGSSINYFWSSNLDYIFISAYPFYGVPDGKEFSYQQSLLHIQKIILKANTLDLSNPENLQIVLKAIQQFWAKGDESSAATSMYMDIVAPFFSALTQDATVLKDQPDSVKNVYAILYSKISDFVDSYHHEAKDAEFGIAMYLKFPLILQVSSGNPVFVSKENVQTFLTKAKALILSGALPKEKVLQFKATAEHLKMEYDNAKSALNYPLTDVSLQLIADITNAPL